MNIMGFVVGIERQREYLEEVISSLSGAFYLDDDNHQLYYHSVRRNCIENKEGRMDVEDWDEFKRKCMELSADVVVNSLKDPKNFDFIVSKFEESPLEYSKLLESMVK